MDILEMGVLVVLLAEVGCGKKSEVFCQVLCLVSLTATLWVLPYNESSVPWSDRTAPALTLSDAGEFTPALTSFLPPHGRTTSCRTQLCCGRELKPGGWLFSQGRGGK